MMADLGMKKGDKVSLFMENDPRYICTWLGLCKIGVVTALVNFNLRSMPLKYSFELADAKAIICGYELTEALTEAYKDKLPNVPIFVSGSNIEQNVLKSGIYLDKEILTHASSTPKEQENTGFLDELFYLFTSGTSGLNKAAVIKHCRFLMAGVAGRIANKMQPDDIVYATLPLYHTNSGIVGVSQTFVNGYTLALRDKFSAKNFWKDCIKYNVTIAQYMGETARYLLRQPVTPEEKQHKVRLMLGNGLRREIWEEFVERFGIKDISELYGSTEGNVSTVNYEHKVGACGFIPILFKNLFPMTIVKLDSNYEPIRDPKTGFLVQCGPYEMGELVGKIQKDHAFRDFKGYASDKAANSKKILSDVFKKGDSVFRTGDLFMKDELGYLYFKDRLGDSFRWKGENVSTTEVEYIISNLTDKLDVVVFPVEVPNADGKCGMAAIADENNNLNLDELSSKIKKTLPSYAIPLFLRIVPSIEITGTHKMKKTELQKEGFGVKSDKNVYFWSNEEGKYVPFTNDLYEKIVAGNIKL
ncbi:Long-chain fatty acid transport protein 1 [Folsomia candida]|uniref:long-chain-fatty-acid--CoA ligase n=2 Tax=Folsomia candida TaxID=158441 RepID=A0A226EDJ2_FOLCA|nr:Long-chain fatty acid transport protein 1 [Folsomia candida]